MSITLFQKIDKFYKMATELEDFEEPDMTEEEIQTDIQKRFGNLSEEQLIELIIKAKRREYLSLLKWFEEGKLSEEYIPEINSIKQKIQKGGYPKINILKENNKYNIYIDDETESLSSGNTKKEALMWAAAYYLS